MNYFDIIAGVLLIYSVIKGFKNGLVIELASLAALVFGLFGAIKFSNITETFLLKHIESSHIGLIAFIVTFIIIVIIVHIIARAVDKLVSAIALGFINRLFGSIFSVLKYAFIMSVILAITDSFEPNFSIIPKEQKEGSALYEPLRSIAPGVFPYLEFEGVQKHIDDVKKGVDV